jgi:cardiolipin synthase (CMP-forming)
MASPFVFRYFDSASSARHSLMPFNFPILLTWLRIVLIPLIVGMFYVPDAVLAGFYRNLAACAIFVLAALTDWFDGYLARKWNQTSAFGAFLDPVADKLMVTAALLVLVQLARIEAAIALVIVGREIAISALREWMAQLGKSKSVAVAFVGKVKTVAQITAIIALLLDTAFLPRFTPLLGTVALWVAAILTLWSMLHYLRLAAPHLEPGATPFLHTFSRIDPNESKKLK